MDQPIDGLLHLFRGNRNTVGLDDNGRGHPGPGDILRDHDVVWRKLLMGHLWGKRGIGVYPYNHEAEAVAWGCVDLDSGEDTAWSQANELRSVLRALGVESWIERSRSKGYHVWVFARDWTHLSDMRRALVAACQIAGAPAEEVNPKSEALSVEQLGNYVRLPYFDTAHKNQRQVIVDLHGIPLPPELFVAEATESAVEPFTLAGIARDYYAPPAPTQRAPGVLQSYDDNYVRAAVESAVHHVMSVPEGARNNTLNMEAFGLLRLFDSEADARTAMELLEEAAILNDLPAAETRRTIASAWKARHKERPDD